MLKPMRTSKILGVYINDVSNGSIFVCGDAGCIRSSFKGSKETTQFSSQLIDNGDSEIVNPFPVWLDYTDEKDEFAILNDPTGSVISMKYVRVLSISSGTTFQIGTSDSVDLESRTCEINRINKTNES